MDNEQEIKHTSITLEINGTLFRFSPEMDEEIESVQKQTTRMIRYMAYRKLFYEETLWGQDLVIWQVDSYKLHV